MHYRACARSDTCDLPTTKSSHLVPSVFRFSVSMTHRLSNLEFSPFVVGRNNDRPPLCVIVLEGLDSP